MKGALPRLVCAIALIALGSSALAAAPPHGGIFVTSLPSGAAVWMDGVYLGETPLYADSVVSGRHALTLIHSGWAPQRTSADVTAGHIATVSLVLDANATLANKAKGFIVVRAAPGSTVSIDGRQLSAPQQPQQLNAGDHILSVERPKVERLVEIVHVYPQLVTVVALTAAAQTASPSSDDDVLVMLDQYVPTGDFSVNGSDITIHHRGVEIECTVGSKAYTFNGKAGWLAVAPAMVGQHAYLPLSLLKRIIGPVAAGH